RARRRQRALPVARDDGFDAQLLDDLGEVLGQRLVVVDDEDQRAHAAAPPGKPSRKLAPSDRASISTLPPCASMRRRQSARPRPLPFALVVNNASNTRARSSAGMPGPSSRTRTRAPPPSVASASTQICPRPFSAWDELMNRLARTCRT